LRTLLDGYEDPNTAERGMLLHDADGLPHIGTAIKFSREPAQLRFSVPALGEHSRAIARELGYTDTELDALARDGVI
jgi:crotonobetainyl-CoA:carnitine CoA-transferase CaiB-like acyl-CoA transferase